MLYMLQSLGMARYLITHRPFLLPMSNYIEIFNELIVLGAAYHMMTLMTENVDGYARELVGISLITLISALIAVNAFAWLYEIIIISKLTCRRY